MKNNIPEEIAKKMDFLLHYVESYWQKVPYYSRNYKNTERKRLNCKELFQHSLEELISCLYPVSRYLAKENKNLFDNYSSILFIDDYKLISEEQVQGILSSIEGYFRGLYYVVYGDQDIEYNGAMYNCYSGIGQDDTIQGLGKMTLGNLIAGELKPSQGNKAPKLPNINNKSGLFDSSNQEVMDLLVTVNRNRNLIVHNSDAVEDDDRFKNEDNENGISIYKRTVIALLLAIDSRYDEIVKVVGGVGGGTIGGLAVTEDKLIEMATGYICNEYTNYIIQSQNSVINKIYRGVDSHSCSLGEDIIEVLLCEQKRRKSNDDDDNSFGAFSLLLHMRSNYTILGGSSGSGKSVIISKLMLEAAKNYQRNSLSEQSLLPIRINLSRYSDPNEKMITLLINSLKQTTNIISNRQEQGLEILIPRLLEQGRLAIFLDGINEIPSNVANAIIENIVNFSRVYKSCRYIISTRLNEIGSKIDMFNGYTIYELCPLNDAQIKAHIYHRKKIYENDSRLNTIWNTIYRDDNLLRFARNPMTLIMLINLLFESPNINISGLNRGGLYKEFIDRLILSESNDDQSRSSKLSNRINILFGSVAKELLLSDKSAISLREVYAIAQSCSFADYVDDLLCLTENMGIVTTSEEELSFVHDSFKEYYQARYLTVALKENNDEFNHSTILPLFDSETPNVDLLAMLFELLEIEKKYVVAFAFAKMLLDKGIDKSSPAAFRLVQNSNEEVTVQLNPDSSLTLNPYLAFLSQSTNKLSYVNISQRLLSTASQSKECENIRVRKYVELLLLNQFYIYKRIYPNGDLNFNYLKDLFFSAAKSGSETILDELFSPYWMRLWLLNQAECREYMKGDIDETDIVTLKEGQRIFLAKIIYNNTNNPKGLLTRQINAVEWMSQQKQQGWAMSLKYLRGSINILLSSIDDSTKKEMFEYFVNSTTMQGYANWILLNISDIDFIIERYNQGSSTTWHDQYINNLLSMYEEPKTLEFILKHIDNFDIVTNKNKNQKVRTRANRVLYHYLFRKRYPQELLDYIWSRDDISNDILDLIPVDLIPQEITQTRYNTKIYDILRERDRRGDNSISYVVYDINADKIRLAIPDFDYGVEVQEIEIVTSDDKKSIESRVCEDKMELSYLTTVKVKRVDNDNMLLPMSGEVFGFNSEGYACSLSYIAAKSDQTGMLLYLWGEEQAQLFQYWSSRDMVVGIDGSECKIIHYSKDSTERYMRVIALERSKELPHYCGQIKVKGLAKGDNNLRLRTPDSYLQYKFNNVALDYIRDGLKVHSDLFFYVYGYTDRGVMLWCEPIVTNVHDKLCLINGLDETLVISDAVPFHSHYVEVLLTGPVMIKLPKYGKIERCESEVEESIPFVYSATSGKSYTLRISDPHYVDMLRSEEFANGLLSEKFVRVNKFKFEITAINTYEHTPNSSMLSVYSIKEFDIESVPNQGTMKIYNKANNHRTLMLLKLGSGTRALCSSVSRVEYIGAKEQSHYFIAYGLDAALQRGLYLKASGIMPFAKVVHSAKVEQAVRCEISLPLEIAPIGVMQLDSAEGVNIHYNIVAQNSVQPDYEIDLRLNSGVSCEKGLDQIVRSAQFVTIGGESLEIFKIDKLTEVTCEQMAVVVLDDRLGCEVGESLENLAVKFYQPIVNSATNSVFFDSVSNSYNIHSVNYIKDGDDLCIAKPLANIDKFTLRVNNGAIRPFVIKKTTAAEENSISDIAMIYLQIEQRDDEVIPQDGTVQFYYDKAGKIPAKLSYDMVSNLINYNHSERHHSSICDTLLEEFKNTLRVNTTLVNFFEMRNKSAELFHYFLSLPEEEFDKVKHLSFNIGCVFVASPIFITIDCPNKRTHITSNDVSGDIKVGDIVIVERNKRITKIDMSLVKPYHMQFIGLYRGYVKELYKKDKESRIEAGLKDDYFYPYIGAKYQPQIGDRVTFFAGYNITKDRKTNKLHEIRNMARRVKCIGSDLKEGEVVEITTQNNSMLRFDILFKDEAGEKTIPAFSPKMLTINENLKAKFESINIGDRVKCIVSELGERIYCKIRFE